MCLHFYIVCIICKCLQKYEAWSKTSVSSQFWPYPSPYRHPVYPKFWNKKVLKVKTNENLKYTYITFIYLNWNGKSFQNKNNHCFDGVYFVHNVSVAIIFYHNIENNGNIHIP